MFQKKFRVLERDEKEDLLQECLTHWYFQRDRYDTSKLAACKTYMSRVIENKLTDIVKEKEAQKRRTIYQSMSMDELNEHVDEEGCVDHPISDDESFRETFKCDVSDVLLQALEKLTYRQRKLCRLIQVDGLNIKQASEALNIPRTTLYEEIFRIRAVFCEEGLKDYL